MVELSKTKNILPASISCYFNLLKTRLKLPAVLAKDNR